MARYHAHVRHYDIHAGNVRFHAVQVSDPKLRQREVIQHSVALINQIQVAVGIPVVTLPDQTKALVFAQIIDFGFGSTSDTVFKTIAEFGHDRAWHHPMIRQRGKELMKHYAALNRDLLEPAKLIGDRRPTTHPD